MGKVVKLIREGNVTLQVLLIHSIFQSPSSFGQPQKLSKTKTVIVMGAEREEKEQVDRGTISAESAGVRKHKREGSLNCLYLTALAAYFYKCETVLIIDM